MVDVESGDVPVRDLRGDLKERLTELDARISELVADYNRRKDELDKEFASLEKEVNVERQATSALLQIEQRRHGELNAPSSSSLTESLPDFLIKETVVKGPQTKDQLRKAANLAGYFPDGESGGRTVHTTLLNLVRANRLQELPGGHYVEPKTFFQDFESSAVQDPYPFPA